MDIGYSRWERRDGADRDAFGLAALEYCRAMREENGVSDARFYWSGVDTVSLLAYVESADVLNRLTGTRFAAATFALADLGRQRAAEMWLDAHVGAAIYAAAHR
jgi:hypothetical protein